MRTSRVQWLYKEHGINTLPRCCHSVLTSCTHDRSKFRVKRGLFFCMFAILQKKGCFHELVLEIEKKGCFWACTRNWKKGVFFSGPWGPCLQFSVFDSDVNWKLTKQKYSRLDSIRIRLTIDDGWRAPVFLTESQNSICTVHVDS